MHTIEHLKTVTFRVVQQRHHLPRSQHVLCADERDRHGILRVGLRSQMLRVVVHAARIDDFLCVTEKSDSTVPATANSMAKNYLG